MIFYLPAIIFIAINVLGFVIYVQSGFTFLGAPALFIILIFAEWVVFGILVLIIILALVKRWPNYKAHIFINLGLFGLVFILFNEPFTVVQKIRMSSFYSEQKQAQQNRRQQGSNLPTTKNKECVMEITKKISKPEVKYVPGEITITFAQKVDGSEVADVLQTYNIQLKSVIFPRQTYFLEVTADKSNEMIDTLKSSNLFTQVDQRLNGATGETSNILFADAKFDTTRQMIDLFVAKQTGLAIKSVDTHAISIVATVPEAGEIERACALRDNESVSNADLNYLTEIID